MKSRRKLTSFNDLTEKDKDKILEYIRVKGISILNASLDLDMTAHNINKIFKERFGKRDKKIKEMKELNLNK